MVGNREGAYHMADYPKMYYILCAAASEALDALPRTPENEAAARILQAALTAAEEVSLDTAEEEA